MAFIAGSLVFGLGDNGKFNFNILSQSEQIKLNELVETYQHDIYKVIQESKKNVQGYYSAFMFIKGEIEASIHYENKNNQDIIFDQITLESNINITCED